MYNYDQYQIAALEDAGITQAELEQAALKALDCYNSSKMVQIGWFAPWTLADAIDQQFSAELRWVTK